MISANSSVLMSGVPVVGNWWKYKLMYGLQFPYQLRPVVLNATISFESASDKEDLRLEWWLTHTQKQDMLFFCYGRKRGTKYNCSIIACNFSEN